MRIVLRGKSILNRIPSSSQFRFNSNRPFCSSTHNNKPAAVNDGSSSNNGFSSSPPLSSYNEQYRALDKLDFPTAAKILFSDPPKKKKFGLDFHLVQLFFACLPSLAVYLVAQYARSEMRKMDAENFRKSFVFEKVKKKKTLGASGTKNSSKFNALMNILKHEFELKKQAEFEAQAKEMELKAAQEKEAVASNPQLLEVKERLDKLEEKVKDIAAESKKELGNSVKTSQEDSNEKRQAAHVEPDNTANESLVKTSKERGTVSTEGQTQKSGLEPVTHASKSTQKENTKGGTFQEAKK